MTTTVDVAAAAGAYNIDALRVEELFVDRSYQRPVDMGRARLRTDAAELDDIEDTQEVR